MKKNIEDYNYNCLNEARDILKSIGMPPQLYNPEYVRYQGPQSGRS